MQAKNLTKTFGKFRAIDNVSFGLKPGEILGLLGPNGAGKTTTLQMLLGVLAPSRGEVFYFGKSLRRYREDILEQVNFSSNYIELPARLKVKECLKFISYLYHISDRGGRIKKIVELFQLSDLLDREIHQLSAGQKNRVNLAKAFLNFPKILLLDEPTASLDPETANYIRNFLLHERDKFNVSIVITSHNMAEVEELCDRVVFINHGRIIADDRPEALARTIRICHVELLISLGWEKIISYVKAKRIVNEVSGRRIRVDLDEAAIPDFLKVIMAQGITYQEISIEKPTLEDYFLSMSNNITIMNNRRI